MTADPRTAILESKPGAAWAKASMVLTVLGIVPVLLIAPCKGMACAGVGVTAVIFLAVCFFLGLVAALISVRRKEPRRMVRGAAFVLLAAVALIVLLNIYS